jgi:Ran GTPase-activating protein 1
VCNNGLSAEAAELLAKILLRQTSDAVEVPSVPSDATPSDTPSPIPAIPATPATPAIPALQLLHFYNNMAGDGGAKALAEIVKACGASLEDFRFSATRSTPSGCESIATALASVPRLRKLDLCDNNFNGKTGDVLKEALRSKTCLEHVNLRDDSLEGTVAVDKLSIFEALVEATAAGSAIKFLDLSGNSFDADAAAQLARALDRMPTIEVLMIDDCELGSEGAKHIAAGVMKMPNLKMLSMCTCEITASGGYHLAKAVASISSFVTLNVDGNMFTENAVEAIRGVLVQASKVLGGEFRSFLTLR